MAHPGPELINLVSSHEATKCYYSSLDMMPVHPMVTTPPPPSSLPFHQVPLTNFWYPFILLGGEGYCKSKVFCTRTQHIDWNPDLLTLSPAQARLQMQTSWLWVHLTTHKTTMSPQEGRVYAESFLIRNKFYNTKKNSIIWFLNRDYWSEFIKDVSL